MEYGKYGGLPYLIDHGFVLNRRLVRCGIWIDHPDVVTRLEKNYDKLDALLDKRENIERVNDGYVNQEWIDCHKEIEKVFEEEEQILSDANQCDFKTRLCPLTVSFFEDKKRQVPTSRYSYKKREELLNIYNNVIELIREKDKSDSFARKQELYLTIQQLLDQEVMLTRETSSTDKDTFVGRTNLLTLLVFLGTILIFYFLC